jgi:glycosyltransferase involved in cell wall biosynthesis
VRNRAAVSVVIPAFNAETYLADAVASVRRQPVQPAEIILIDDGSTDGTAEIISSLPDVISIRTQNSGPSAARNRGVAAATQEFVAFLDADDLWPDESLGIRLARFDQEPALDVVLGLSLWISEPGVHEAWAPSGEHIAPLVGAALFRRSVFDRIGLFDTDLRFGEDQDFFLRLREHDLNLAVLQTSTLHYRRHGSNMTAGKEWARPALFRFLRKSLDRRRNDGGDRREIRQLSDYADPPDPEAGRR